MKNIRIFYPKNCHFLVVKFSVYLNRRVFVMEGTLADVAISEGTLADVATSEGTLADVAMSECTSADVAAHMTHLGANSFFKSSHSLRKEVNIYGQ